MSWIPGFTIFSSGVSALSMPDQNRPRPARWLKAIGVVAVEHPFDRPGHLRKTGREVVVAQKIPMQGWG